MQVACHPVILRLGQDLGLAFNLAFVSLAVYLSHTPTFFLVILIHTTVQYL